MNTLERLKELARKATPGPWEVSKDFPWVVVAPEPAKLGKGHVYFSCSCGGGNNEENAVYLASALNALPLLIEVAEAARELLEVAKLRGDNEFQHPADDPKLWTARMQDAWDTADAALAKLTEEE